MAIETWLGISLTPHELRCLVINEHGRTEGSSIVPLGYEERRSPDAWWTALKQALGDLADTGLDLSALTSIGLAGTPCGAVFLDEAGTVLVPAILAGDTEAQASCTYLEATARRSRSINGNLAKPDMLGAALLHLRDEAPDTFQRLAHVLSPRDFLQHRLTGKTATDPSTASASLLYDLVQGTWSERILKPIGLERNLLPELYNSDTRVAPVLDTPAKELGIPQVPVIAGASDLAATCVCLGLEQHGESLLVLAEQTTLVRLSKTFGPDPFRHIDMRSFTRDGLFFHLANTGPGAAFDTWAGSLEAQASAETPGKELYFLPKLEHGAVLAGLTPDATPRDMGQAILCGVAFEIAESLGVMNELLATGDDLVFLAPPSLGNAWGPYLASATGKTLVFHEDDGFAAARGAALLARRSHGEGPGVPETEKPQPVEHFQPQPDLKVHFDNIRPKLAGLKSRLTHPG